MPIRIWLLAIITVLAPSAIWSQSEKYTNCHTPESAGNFVGPDETVVNGMICKPVPQQTAKQEVAPNHLVPASAIDGTRSSSTNPTLTNARIVELSTLGLDDDIVIAKIRNGNCQFQLGDSDLIQLKKAGVSPKVIAAMLDAGSASPASEEPPKSVSAPAAAPEPSEEGSATGSSPIPSGARVVIAPMGGFETYFAAAVREKKVPVTLTLNKETAQYFVVSTKTEWAGFVYGSGGNANWDRNGGSAAYGSAGASTRGLEASIMVINARTKDVVWAYEVHKSSHGALLLGTHAARGQQSLAEACAKHLKDYIEKGK